MGIPLYPKVGERIRTAIQTVAELLLEGPSE
jgi:hypothetical protein